LGDETKEITTRSRELVKEELKAIEWSLIIIYAVFQKVGSEYSSDPIDDQRKACLLLCSHIFKLILTCKEHFLSGYYDICRTYFRDFNEAINQLRACAKDDKTAKKWLARKKISAEIKRLNPLPANLDFTDEIEGFLQSTGHPSMNVAEGSVSFSPNLESAEIHLWPYYDEMQCRQSALLVSGEAVNCAIWAAISLQGYLEDKGQIALECQQLHDYRTDTLFKRLDLLRNDLDIRNKSVLENLNQSKSSN